MELIRGIWKQVYSLWLKDNYSIIFVVAINMCEQHKLKLQHKYYSIKWTFIAFIIHYTYIVISQSSLYMYIHYKT